VRAALADESSKHAERLEVLGKQLTQVIKSPSKPLYSTTISALTQAAMCIRDVQL
jgi:hypothetical protein